MSAEITLISKAAGGSMSKVIDLDERGALRSDGSACFLVEGTAIRRPAATAAELADIIASCGSNQALALGSLKEDLPSPARVVTKRAADRHPGAITRTRDFIDYRPNRPAWGLVDVDTKGMPPEVRARIDAAGDVWRALLEVAPDLARAARVSRGSTSSGLVDTSTDEPVAGSTGQHHYLLVRDGADIERFLKDLHDRAWLNGFGWHLIGAAGQLLDRSIVDRFVGYGERLVFEGQPQVLPPLLQDPAKRRPEAIEGEAIDSTSVVPPLNELERHRVGELKAASAAALGKVATEVRTKHDKVMADKLVKSGVPLVRAQRLVAARHHGVLSPHIDLEFDDHDLGIKTVANVLADPDRFVGETLADPLEGVAYGRCIAMVMQRDEGTLFIHSFAHGRSFYELRHDIQSAKAALTGAPAGAVVDHAMSVLAAAALEADEVADFAAAVAKAADVKVSAVKARIDKERKDRAEARRRAAMAAEAEADGRIVRPRPEADGELGPTLDFLDQVLAADQSKEPPMRDASGILVEVRVREPWNMHLLTADGANADAAEDAETIKAPAEPALVQLSPSNTELLVEKYVRWRVDRPNRSYYGALHRPYIDALREHSPSAVPVARAIITAPLIAASGRVIDGDGLDRKTGLIHRTDPLLRACLPNHPPSKGEVREALKFLLDEWLVDVALDPVDKCVVVMMALTIIERVLLPERPAFFVTAGTRGGGKTTLVSMIIMAALGRRPSAAGWSAAEEERKKALFSYLRAGVACIVWDNIPRGSAISCPSIEASLTISEVSDRVLGVSRTEQAAATAVQIFTGNAIAPRGDMASRSLMIALNVNRPDPENRDFKHPQPLDWTSANRAKILRALYTLMVAGALNRPQQQRAETRFKTWWSLCGWPVEHAAKLLKIDVDCAKLLRTGEIGDEEMSATANVYSIFHEIWKDKPFTAREVVAVLDAETTTSEWRKARARAEDLHDALGEIIGKRLEHPTGRSLGKLFQKHLVDRPAWVGDNEGVATLRKSTGHNQNTYRLEVEGSMPERQDDPHPADAPPSTAAQATGFERVRAMKFPLGSGGAKAPYTPYAPEDDTPDPAKAAKTAAFGRRRQALGTVMRAVDTAGVSDDAKIRAIRARRAARNALKNGGDGKGGESGENGESSQPTREEKQ